VGALCWSLNIFRLSSWVNKGIEPVALQAWKTIILSGMYFVWMFIEVAKSGWAWNLLWPGIAGSAVGLAVLAFSAIGPGRLACQDSFYPQNLEQRELQSSRNLGEGHPMTPDEMIEAHPLSLISREI
jgi:hypothetical protein